MKNYGWGRNPAKWTRADWRASDHVDGRSPILGGVEMVLWEVRRNRLMQTEVPHARLTIKSTFTPTQVFSDRFENDTTCRPLASPPQPCSNNPRLNYTGTLPMSEQHRWILQLHI